MCYMQTHNLEVPGSSPGWPTTRGSTDYLSIGSWCFFVSMRIVTASWGVPLYYRLSITVCICFCHVRWVTVDLMSDGLRVLLSRKSMIALISIGLSSAGALRM